MFDVVVKGVNNMSEEKPSVSQEDLLKILGSLVAAQVVLNLAQKSQQRKQVAHRIKSSPKYDMIDHISGYSAFDRVVNWLMK